MKPLNWEAYELGWASWLVPEFESTSPYEAGSYDDELWRAGRDAAQHETEVA